MKKFEVFKESVEIKKKESDKIKSGCVIDCQCDHYPELIKSFDTLEEAKDFFKEFVSSIRDYGRYYLVEEYYIKENVYEFDEVFEEWEIADGSGDIWEFSKLAIELVERPSYECIGVFDNMKDAEEAYNLCEGECFLSF